MAARTEQSLVLRDLMTQAIKYAANGKLVEWGGIFSQITRMLVETSWSVSCSDHSATSPTCRHNDRSISNTDAAVVNEIAVIAFGFSPRSMRSRQFAQAAVHALCLLGTLVEQDPRCSQLLSMEAAAMMGDVASEWIQQAYEVKDWDDALPGLPLLFEALATCWAALLAKLPEVSRDLLLQPFSPLTEQETPSHDGAVKLRSMVIDLQSRTGHCRLLHMGLLCLFSEPLLVLAPTAGAGWLVSISGVTDTQQLHTLLACQLGRFMRESLTAGAKQSGQAAGSRATPPPPGLPGLVSAALAWPSKQQFLAMSNIKATSSSPPGDRPAVDLCESLFDILQPSALADEACSEYLAAVASHSGTGHLTPPKSYARYILGTSSVPADLCCVQGLRIAVLAPRTEVTTWAPQACFPLLRAKCTMQRQLEDDEIVEWQHMCAQGQLP